jgi:hypothetical protein
MAATTTQVNEAKAVLREVLSGALSPTAPQFVDDDVLARQVAIVEAVDAPWLVRELENAAIAVEVRLRVALQLRGPHRLPLLRALGAPPFLLR